MIKGQKGFHSGEKKSSGKEGKQHFYNHTLIFWGVNLAFERTRFTTVTISITASAILYLQFKNKNKNFSCANIYQTLGHGIRKPTFMPQLNQNHFIFVEIFMCAQSPKVSGLKKKFNFKPP